MIKKMPNLDKMSTKEKYWFASAIAGMIVADGHTDKKELDSLRDAINFLESKEEIDRLMDIVRQGRSPDLSKLDIDSDQSFLILRYLVVLMAIDSECSQKEIKFLLKIAELLNFNDYSKEITKISSNSNNVKKNSIKVSKESVKIEKTFKKEDYIDSDMDYEL